MNLEDFYNERMSQSNGINEHLPVLFEYAKKCRTITEFGFGKGNSACAFLMANPQKVISYDIRPNMILFEQLKSLAGETDFRVIQGDTARVEIEETDLLFIDSRHTGLHLSRELFKSPKVRRWIILHDTELHKHKGDIGGVEGLAMALYEFLLEGYFCVEKHYPNCNGLTVLRRVK